MPFRCRWRISSGTQASEKAKNKSIAVKVALEDLQRHSSVRKGQKQVNCRLDAAGGSPAALKRYQVALQRQKSAWTSQEAIRTPSDNQKPAINWAEFCQETRNILGNPLTPT